jgi:acyl-CoA synthetase (AMP-forming)/AMP-acid ligase II
LSFDLFGTLADHAASRPDREAVVCGDARTPYRMLWRRSAALANLLVDLGLAQGDVVPMRLDDDVDFIVGLLGALMAGGRPFPLHPGATQAEERRLLGGHDPALSLATTSEARVGEHAVCGPFRSEADRPAIRPSAPEVLLATSGSTGDPRVARLSLPGIAWNAAAHAESIGLTADDRLLAVSPMAHSATLVAQVVATLQLGATLVVAPRPFTTRTFIETLGAEKVTATALIPAHVRWLADQRAESLLAEADLTHLRIVTIGAAPIAPGLLAAFSGLLAARTASRARVFVTYGMTEAGPRITTLGPADMSAHADSVGRPLAGVTVRVVNPAAPAIGLPPGSEGELQVRTPGRLLGYLLAPPDAGDIGETDVWLPTGDLATIDEAGFVQLRGRLKELIISGGAKISPREVEAALLENPGVRDAAVVAEPHDALGEIARAYVVPAGPLTEDEILADLATRLAPFKLPRRIVVVDALPYLPAGKVDKRRLAQLAPTDRP